MTRERPILFSGERPDLGDRSQRMRELLDQNAKLRQELTRIADYAAITDGLTIADEPVKCAKSLVMTMVYNRDLEIERLKKRQLPEGWLYEDQLPQPMPDYIYKAWYLFSRVIDGVRVGPYVDPDFI